ncbi:hypothetical protein IPL68_07340 [Candidatus Saccharibacteria bacterium]|nr:MAG: hypothetical protein IPL68_07340 [Candidatus Saccharibacteria bacterium]
MIEAIINKVNNPHALCNIKNIVRSLGDTFQTNASRDEVAALLKQQMNNLGSWQTESISVDGSDSTGTTYSMGALPLYVMEPNPASVALAQSKIQQYLR